jgi:hypothetical protein
MRSTCRHPDHDQPKLMCGWPLPCPYHTAVIDTAADPPTVTIPVTSQAAWVNRDRLAEVGDAFRKRRRRLTK